MLSFVGDSGSSSSMLSPGAAQSSQASSSMAGIVFCGTPSLGVSSEGWSAMVENEDRAGKVACVVATDMTVEVLTR
jgi:hypothetical protein